MAIEPTEEGIVECENCGRPAENALCERHFEYSLDEAYEKGKKEGYDEGYEKAREEFEPEPE